MNVKGKQTNTGRTHFKKGHSFGKRFIKGFIPWNKNKEFPIMKGYNNPAKRPEVRAKISEKAKLRIGKLSSNYKHGLSGTKEYNNRKAKGRFHKRKVNGGFFTKGEWENLKAQYNFTCPCCKRQEPDIKLEADHVVPVKRGGSGNIENIQPLCRNCNAQKHIKVIKYEY